MLKENNHDIQKIRIKKSFFERPSIKTALGFVIILLAAIVIALIDFKPSLSHLKIGILSGSRDGNYYAIVETMKQKAREQKGTILNTATSGSLDNIKLLGENAQKCRAKFALVQDGLDWGDKKRFEFIAHLPVSETVFLLGYQADRIKTFHDLQNKRIGIGPIGSGTSLLAKQIFSVRSFKSLNLRLSHHDIKEQLGLLKNGKLDLAFFVITDEATLIDQAVGKDGLQIASFLHARSMAGRIPFLSAGVIRAGHYDPVKVLPPEDKFVLKVNTLVVGNKCAARSDTMALLSLLSLTFPGFITYHNTNFNATGLVESPYARNYFSNQGMEPLDKYAPWLVDIVPLGNLVHIIMAVSILFNVMGFANRFRLWRIDASRVELENKIPGVFGAHITMKEVMQLIPGDKHKLGTFVTNLDTLISAFTELKSRCRAHSLSMLVPMGQEMSYRYQESLLDEIIAALNIFRERLANK